MRRSRSQYTVLIGVSVLAVSAVLVNVQRNFADSGTQRDQFLGSYLVEISFNGDPTSPHPGLVTLHADGTVTAADTTDFGLGGIFDFNSPNHGNWEPTGPREISATLVNFSYNANGEHISSGTTAAKVEFPKNSETFEGRFRYELFALGDDLFNDEPLAHGYGTISGRRIPVPIW